MLRVLKAILDKSSGSTDFIADKLEKKLMLMSIK